MQQRNKKKRELKLNEQNLKMNQIFMERTIEGANQRLTIKKKVSNYNKMPV